MLCAAFAGCNLMRHGPLDPALTAFIPPDTVVLSGVHMDQIRAAPLYRKLAAQNRLPRFDEFPAEAGFDPQRDVNEVMLASDGNRVLAAARGDFKGKRPRALQPTPYKSYQLFIKDDRTAIAYLDDHTVLGGSHVAVRAAIDQWSTHSGSGPADLLARVRALPADAQIWAVALGWKGASAATLRQMGNAANLDRLLRSVEAASLTVDFRAGVHAAATGNCRTDAEAKTLSDQLRGFAGLARLSVPKNRPELLRVFDGIRVAQEGQLVKLNIDVPEDLAEQLVNQGQ